MALPPPPLNSPAGSFAWQQWYLSLSRLFGGVAGAVPWLTIDFTGSDLSDLASRAHNVLQSTQGGASGELYHLTSAQHTDLTDGGDTTLHIHSADRARANHTGTQALATISDVTASASEVNLLDGVTATTTELNYIDGVTSAIQTQLDGKQPLDAQLTDVAGLAVTDGNFIVGNGTNFVAESGATARTSLGLGTIATQDANNVTITGGAVTGITDIVVADGGTGRGTATEYAVICGGTTSTGAHQSIASVGSVGQVLTSNGAGSLPTFQDAASGGGGSFSTGDVKLSFKTTESGWVVMNDGTIGSAASGATTRANADTEDLFVLLWDNVADAQAAVSGGRGASGAADFAANKTLALPKALGRSLANYGTGSGLTARVLGQIVGAETHTLSQAETPVKSHSHTASGSVGMRTNSAVGTATIPSAASTSIPNTSAAVSVTVNAAGDATASAHNIMQPTLFLNVLIKL